MMQMIELVDSYYISMFKEVKEEIKKCFELNEN